MYVLCIVYNQELLWPCSENALIIHTLSDAASIYIIYDDFILYYFRSIKSILLSNYNCVHTYMRIIIYYINPRIHFCPFFFPNRLSNLLLELFALHPDAHTLIYKTVSLPFHSLSYNIQYLYFV